MNSNPIFIWFGESLSSDFKYLNYPYFIWYPKYHIYFLKYLE